MPTNAMKLPSKQRPRSSNEDDDSRLLKAITRLWLKTKHTADQETQREEIFSLWLTDLSNWPVRQTEAVLNQMASSQEWWPAWTTVVEALPSPTNAIGYENLWARIRRGSVRDWAKQVASAYIEDHCRQRGQRLDSSDHWRLTNQASHLALGDGVGTIGVECGVLWSGEKCLQAVGSRRQAA